MITVFRYLFLFLISIGLQAQIPKQYNATEIYQKIQKLNILGNVLYLAAHPDDENTRFISYSANEKLFNTAYLSLTRGDGGQNLIGPEIREELGIIRTQELLAARRTDGGKQFFSRANDFGYSKTPNETLEIWDKNTILADVVWVIRKFKPDIIVCRFPTNGKGGHGHHTSSAILAEEAFDLAGDPTQFPEQLQYVQPWQPKRLVLNTGRWWNDSISEKDPNVVAHDLGVYNSYLGTSYNELAARSRSMHKSQGFGMIGNRGSQMEYFELQKGAAFDQSLWDGVVSNWERVKDSKKVQELVTQLSKNYTISNPSLSIPTLIQLRKELQKIEDPFWKKIKLQEVDELIKQCAGIYFEAKADDFAKTSQDSLQIDFEFLNRSNQNIRIESIKSTSLDFSKNLAQPLSYNTKIELKEKLTLQKLPISQPYWLKEKATLGTYQINDQTLIGIPENQPTITFTIHTVIEDQKIAYTIPLIYKWRDPVKGERYRPFIITPKITATLDQPIYLFSSSQEKEVIVTLKAGAQNQSGNIDIKAPNGWKLDYKNHFNLQNKGEELKLKVRLKPLQNAQNGNLIIFINGKKAQALRTIQYDHIPTQTWFPDSQIQLVYVPIKKTGKKIGYIEGAGDTTPEALRNIGYQIDLLKEEHLTLENLKQYDAILTGIRFLNINERADFMMPKLLQYAKEGGNLIVQYNTNHSLKTKHIAPYPLTLSRDRVTEEKAIVQFLKPDHPVLNSPNKLTKKDFEGWVQERGLYFPNEWDQHYQAILSWHDKNETDKKGSLLITPYGKGHYIYTGISFFRELPAGVPGAYRLLVNMIEL
ncbi:hypothetical protein UJ101_01426 [Flavobacteriaceae bacterium UJ101]|nr:hypothetical protein UJ101_01426 [Flavobacteriaceae bacterium UJ101]